ncbi:MAG: translocation/assembly module TamB domain-containing protein [candidate division WOR-3 bacterium]|nr:translocation/assembly module TamB domain-containing protein [candidate division WOR-3 bacterium]MCX7947893.1 translocation/assembly module TamB domain-containing protein [candidate division WOR-3 bacterium]MDW8150715.1 translocation/assembly module TamB domain-containing protein [candidate division WOR-3 bacterium]
MVKKIAKGIIALLTITLVVISAIIVYFLSNIDIFIKSFIERSFTKPLIYKKLEIKFNEIKLHKFYMPNVLSGDSLKILLSPLDVINHRSIYRILGYNIYFNVDSFNNSIRRTEVNTPKSKKFQTFSIRNINFYNVNIKVGNVNVVSNEVFANVISYGEYIKIETKIVNASENQTIRQKIDSIFSKIKVFSDSILISSSIYSDSIFSKNLGLSIFPEERYLTLNSSYARFKTIGLKNFSARIEIESLKIFANCESLAFNTNSIKHLITEIRIKSDTLLINYASFRLLDGDISVYGMVIDTSYNLKTKVKNLKFEKSKISGNFYLSGYFSGNLYANFDSVELIYDTLRFSNINGSIYSKELKNFDILGVSLNNNDAKIKLNGKYNIERQEGKINLSVDYIAIEKLNNFISGSASFYGEINLKKKSLEILGIGNLYSLKYENYKLDSGNYSVYFRDSLLKFSLNLLNGKVNDSLILDSAKVDYEQIKNKAIFSVLAFLDYGNIISNGDLILKDTIKSNFSLTFLNTDTIFKSDNVILENYKNYYYLKLKNDNIILEATLDSNNIDFYLLSSNYDFSKILSIFKIDSISFGGDIVLRITNKIDDPKAYLYLDLNNVKMKQFFLEKLNSTIYYYDRNINVDNINLVSKNGIFEGHIVLSSLIKLKPFSITLEEGIVNGNLKFTAFPLDIIEPILFPNFVVEDGYIQGNVNISGSVASPTLSGGAIVYSKDVAFVPIEIEFRKSEGKISFYKNTIRIDNFTLEGFRIGRAIVNGYILISNRFKDINVDLSIDFTKIYLSLDDYTEFYASGMIRILGKIPNIYVEGNINIDEGYISYPIGYKARNSTPSPNPIRYYINIRADRRIFFSNELVDAELSANLILQKNSDFDQYFEGSFEIIKGKFYLYSLNSDFNITDGKINVIRNNINFNIKGEATLYDDTIIAQVTGTLENPIFELSSVKGKSQLELLNMVLSGSISERGINLAQQIFTRNIRKRFRIDELTFGTIGNGALLTLGSYITENIYLKLSTDIQNPANSDLKVQYFIRRNLSLFGKRDNNSYTVGIGYRLRF